MKKRILVLIMVVAMLMATSVSAFAVASVDVLTMQEVREDVREANKDILDLIKVAKIAAKENPDDVDSIITKLVADTELISSTTIGKADIAGIEVLCEYKNVVIGKVHVEIDPLVVGGW
jgi:ABC-type transporter MlaC component